MILDLLGLTAIPDRPSKPRQRGVTIALDKGLSPREAEDFMETSAGFVDFVKLGWGTALITPRLDRKLEIYRDAGVSVFLGGTAFEVFAARDAVDEYESLLDRLAIDCVEISDGALEMGVEQKLTHIRRFSRERRVMSEVGSKDADHVMPPYKWVEAIRSELEAGSWKVICEARESGTAGIFRPNGEVRSGLVDEITELLGAESVIFEAPRKEQQTWFIKHLGMDVNLGNVRPSDALALETLRLGLRADTLDLHFRDSITRLRKARQDDDTEELREARSLLNDT